ncbi:hypothetical protein [Shewanella woodyi]|nr:hypothetical protein [Shewanella woodyi]
MKTNSEANYADNIPSFINLKEETVQAMNSPLDQRLYPSYLEMQDSVGI